MDKKRDFAVSIKKLEEINDWFQKEDIDLDEGLTKLKEGQKLIEACRKRLADVENEFVKIQTDIEKADTPPAKEETGENGSDDNGIPF